MKGWLSVFSMSIDDDLFDLLLLLTKKKATRDVTTSSEMTIPAIAPAPIPDFLESPLLVESRFEPPPDLWLGERWTGGVPGGGGGAGPLLNELPSFLFAKNKKNERSKVQRDYMLRLRYSKKIKRENVCEN